MTAKGSIDDKIKAIEKRLNDKELAMLEKNDILHKIVKMEMMLEQKNVENMLLKKRLMDTEIGFVNQKIENIKTIEAARLAEKRDFIKLMEKKHKLSGKWGYCPDSGEIKEDNE